VGKTSLARSIAQALGRKFVECRSAACADEGGDRGHSADYIGALPGRFIQGFGGGRVEGIRVIWTRSTSSGRTSVAIHRRPARGAGPEQNNTFPGPLSRRAFDLSDSAVHYDGQHPGSGTTGPQGPDGRCSDPGYTEEEKLKIATDHLVKAGEESRATSDYIRFGGRRAPPGDPRLHARRRRRNLDGRSVRSAARWRAAERRVDEKHLENPPEGRREMLGAPRFLV